MAPFLRGVSVPYFKFRASARENFIGLNRHGMANSRLAALAKEDGRVLLTHDKGFANIIAYPPDQYSGIVRINIHPPRLIQT